MSPDNGLDNDSGQCTHPQSERRTATADASFTYCGLCYMWTGGPLAGLHSTSLKKTRGRTR